MHVLTHVNRRINRVEYVSYIAYWADLRIYLSSSYGNVSACSTTVGQRQLRRPIEPLRELAKQIGWE
jgi:hypothetical protein